MGEVIRFPGSTAHNQMSKSDADSVSESVSDIDPNNLLYEGDDISSEQFQLATINAIEALELTASITATRGIREIREELVDTYTAPQVVRILHEATERDWKTRPQLYRALALRFYLIAKQHQQ